MGKRARSGSSDGQKESARILQQNMKSAQGYVRYLDSLSQSMRGARSDEEASRLVAQAQQTRRYLLLLQSRSSSAAR